MIASYATVDAPTAFNGDVDPVLTADAPLMRSKRPRGDGLVQSGVVAVLGVSDPIQLAAPAAAPIAVPARRAPGKTTPARAAAAAVGAPGVAYVPAIEKQRDGLRWLLFIAAAVGLFGAWASAGE